MIALDDHHMIEVVYLSSTKQCADCYAWLGVEEMVWHIMFDVQAWAGKSKKSETIIEHSYECLHHRYILGVEQGRKIQHNGEYIPDVVGEPQILAASHIDGEVFEVKIYPQSIYEWQSQKIDQYTGGNGGLSEIHPLDLLVFLENFKQLSKKKISSSIITIETLQELCDKLMYTYYHQKEK